MLLKATVQKETPKQSLPKVTSEAAVRRCSSNQVLLEIFCNIHRKTFVLESRYNKFSGLYLKETPTQVFSCEYCKIFTIQTAFFIEHLRGCFCQFDNVISDYSISDVRILVVQTGISPLLTVYFNVMQINRWLYLSSILQEIPLYCDLF